MVFVDFDFEHGIGESLYYSALYFNFILLAYYPFPSEGLFTFVSFVS